MIKEEHIRNIAEQHLAGTDKFIVSVKVKPGNKIIIFIDADSSVSISDCAQLSRFVESSLDRGQEDFDLEVSSAGLDYPLMLQRQYKKNTGREVKVILKNGNVKTGFLNGADENGFEISKSVTERINNKKEKIIITETLSFAEIKETRILIKI